MSDLINRQDAIYALTEANLKSHMDSVEGGQENRSAIRIIMELPSAEPEQRYTEEELRVFAHGISLRLLSKRSAQHWRYDKDTATEIEFLERLYDKVSINIQEEGEQNE